MSLAELRDISLYRVMRALPVSLVSRIGASLGQILGRRTHPAAAARAAATILLLRPDLARDPHTLDAAQTRLWANVGRVYAEFCVLDKIVRERRATISDPGIFDAVLADGRPVIVAFAHLGNWETITSQIVDRAPGRLAALANPLPRNRVQAHIASLQRGQQGFTVMTIDGNIWRRAMRQIGRASCRERVLAMV
jgi:lauroyl/myristoyl acyltransferase